VVNALTISCKNDHDNYLCRVTGLLPKAWNLSALLVYDLLSLI